MSWILLALVLATSLFGVFAYLHLRIRGNSLLIADEIRARYGSGLRFLGGCGIVSSHSRVPGVLALLDDRLIYTPALTSRHIPREIFLKDITEHRLEDTARTSLRRARKYRNAAVFVVRTSSGEEHGFVLQKGRTADWERAFGKAWKASS